MKKNIILLTIAAIASLIVITTLKAAPPTYGDKVLAQSTTLCTELSGDCGYDFATYGFTFQECVDVTKDSICDNGNPNVCDAPFPGNQNNTFQTCLQQMNAASDEGTCEALWTSNPIPPACVDLINLRDVL